MPLTQSIGRKGEAAAARFLREQGFRITHRNWRWRRYELDIIARKESLILFVEVKTRKREHPLPPKALVNAKKRGGLRKAARAYLLKKQLHNALYRFDVIVVRRWQGKETIDHFTHVFNI